MRRRSATVRACLVTSPRLPRVCRAKNANRSFDLSPKNDVTFRRHYLWAGSHRRQTDFTDTAAIIKTQGRVFDDEVKDRPFARRYFVLRLRAHDGARARAHA